MEIRFREPAAWQVVDESFTFYDEYEEREPGDAGRLRVLARSKYLDHFEAGNTGYSVIRGRTPGKHYRVWTEYEVMDIISFEPPDTHEVAVAQQNELTRMHLARQGRLGYPQR